MNWLSLLIGVLIGWLVEWIIDIFYWRRRAAGSSAGGSRVSQDAARLPADGDRLAAALRQNADSERLLQASEATVRAQATEIAGLQARLADFAELERRLAQCEGDLGHKSSAAALEASVSSGVEPGAREPLSGTAVEGWAAAGALPAENDDTLDWAEVKGPRRAPAAAYLTQAVEPPASSGAASSAPNQAGAEETSGAAAAELATPTAAELPAGSSAVLPAREQAETEQAGGAAPAVERLAATAVTPGPAATGAATVKADDLEIIEGIGPKIAALLKQNGITTFAELAAADVAQIRAILHAAGPRFQMANPATWMQQAALAAAGKWDELKVLQDRLSGGVEEKRQ